MDPGLECKLFITPFSSFSNKTVNALWAHVCLAQLQQKSCITLTVGQRKKVTAVTSFPAKTLNCHISRTRHTRIPLFALNWDLVSSNLYTKHHAISSTGILRIWPVFVPLRSCRGRAGKKVTVVTFFRCPTVTLVIKYRRSKIVFLTLHDDDIIKWKHFPRYWPIVRGIHRSHVNSPNKGGWRGALMLSLICTWKRVSKQSKHRWSETPSCSLWRHCNVIVKFDSLRNFCRQAHSTRCDTGISNIRGNFKIPNLVMSTRSYIQ